LVWKQLATAAAVRFCVSMARPSDFAALEVVGGLTACTKLGNGPNNRRVPDIMKGLGAIAEVEWTILQQMALVLKFGIEHISGARAVHVNP